MKYGTWNLGQIEALINRLGEDNAKKILDCSEVVVSFDGSPKQASVTATAPSETLLLPNGSVSLLASPDRFDPVKYFKTGEGLYVSDDFAQRILKVAKPVNSLSEEKFGSFDLTQDATDQQIQAELPHGHIFEDASMFCAHLAGMIQCQPGGMEGPLLNNGYANIFYVRGVSGEVFAVRVRWVADGRGWGVDAYRLDDGRWYAGHRAFSRTA